MSKRSHVFVLQKIVLQKMSKRSHVFVLHEIVLQKMSKKFQDGFLRSLIKDFAGLGRGSKVEYRTIHQKEKEVFHFIIPFINMSVQGAKVGPLMRPRRKT